MIVGTKPKVSVVTMYYKRANFVERTLDSLLNQSLKDIEILVVDDHSPDETGKTILDYCAKRNDRRLVPIINQVNHGFTRGIIKAIEGTKADYIAIQGSGDSSHPDRLRLQSKFLDENPTVGVVGCFFNNIDEIDDSVLTRAPRAEAQTLDSLRKKNVFAHGEVMIRRSFYEQVGGYRWIFKFSADHDLWLRMIKICRFYTIPIVLYDRYMLRDGVSYDPKKAVEMSQYNALVERLSYDQDKYFEYEKKFRESGVVSDLIPLSDEVVQRRLIRLAMRFSFFGDHSGASYVLRSINGGPLQWGLRFANLMASYYPFSILLSYVRKKYGKKLSEKF